MDFQHKYTEFGDDILCIKTNQHISVRVLFENGKATYIYADNNEFNLVGDTVFGLFVGIGDKVVSLIEVALEAANQFADIKAEVEEKELEAAAIERELSSPYLTGRI